MCIKVDLLYKNNTEKEGVALTEVKQEEHDNLATITFYFTADDMSEAKACNLKLTIEDVKHSYEKNKGYSTMVRLRQQPQVGGRQRSGAVSTSADLNRDVNSVDAVRISFLSWKATRKLLREIDFSWLKIDSVKLYLDDFEKGSTFQLLYNDSAIAFLKKQTPIDYFLTEFATNIQRLISCGEHAIYNNRKISIHVPDCKAVSDKTAVKKIITLIVNKEITYGKTAKRTLGENDDKDHKSYLEKRLQKDTNYFSISKSCGKILTVENFLKGIELPKKNLLFCLGVVSISDALSLNHDRIIQNFHPGNMLFANGESSNFYCIDNAVGAIPYREGRLGKFLDYILATITDDSAQNELEVMLKGEKPSVPNAIYVEFYKHIWGCICNGSEASRWSNDDDDAFSNYTPSIESKADFRYFMFGFLTGVLKLLENRDKLVAIYQDRIDSMDGYIKALKKVFDATSGEYMQVSYDLGSLNKWCVYIRDGLTKIDSLELKKDAVKKLLNTGNPFNPSLLPRALPPQSKK